MLITTTTNDKQSQRSLNDNKAKEHNSSCVINSDNIVDHFVYRYIIFLNTSHLQEKDVNNKPVVPIG